MKKRKILFVILFALVYAVVLSFGIECLLNCIGIMGTSVFAEYPPYLYWSSFIAGILATVALVVIFIFNFRIAESCEYDKYAWWIQMISSLVLTFFLVKPWELLFLHIRETI